MRSSLVHLGALVALAGAAHAQTTWHVDDDTCPAAGSGSFGDPFCSIQDAIDAASSGDAVLVAPGTYEEPIDFKGKVLVVRSKLGPDVTRITGGSGLPAAVVTFDSGETSAARLEGFTIGKATAGFTDRHGILCSGSSPTIVGNTIEHNTPSSGGGGISCVAGAAPTIARNLIQDNESIPGTGAGGGIYCNGASPWILGNVIQGNSCFADPGGYGGGIYLKSSAAVVENNLIVGNAVCDQGFGGGGGIAIGPGVGPPPLLIGNTIADNFVCTTGIGEGGGIYAADAVEIRDTILWGNTGNTGHELFVAAGGAAFFYYTTFDHSAGALAGSGMIGQGTGSLDADPMFVAPGDYHIWFASPMVDAGDPARAPGGTDGDVEPRILDGDRDGAERVDIGWDEFDLADLTVTGTPALGGMITAETAGPDGWSYFLVLSLGTDDIPFSPYGSILVSLTELFTIGFGSVPGTDVIPMPVDPEYLGLRFHLQALVKKPGQKLGSFSRRVDLIVE